MTTEHLDIASVIAAGEGKSWTSAPQGTVMGHVHLHVGNLADAERFYHRAIGFDKTVWSYPGALFLSAGGYHHHLGTNVWSPGPSPTENEARLLEWELIVSPDGGQAVTERLRVNGYRMSASPDGVRTADPWGTRLHVIEEAGS
jgi:catechol 2,3-dioxygenase